MGVDNFRFFSKKNFSWQMIPARGWRIFHFISRALFFKRRKLSAPTIIGVFPSQLPTGL